MAQVNNFNDHPANEAFAAAAQAVADALANNDMVAANAAMELVRQHLAAVQAAAADAIAAIAADEALGDDDSTVLGENDEPWEVFEDELPDALLNSVQHARHALELVRAQADVTNSFKNRLYLAFKNTFNLFLGEPAPLADWRHTYEAEMEPILPHLPADLLAPHLEAFQQAFQALVDELHPLAQGGGTYDGFPALPNDIYYYVRRMLRIPEPAPHEENQ
jgi:hypothetical protein